MEQILGFSAMAAVIIVIPGPSVLFVVGRALAYGRRTALVGVVGNALGAMAASMAVALGIGSVVARSAVVFTALKLAGAAYIVFLGVQAIRHRRSLHDALVRADRAGGDGRSLWQGFVVGVTNPKTLVFFAAVLPQFARPEQGHVPLQMAVFGLIFVAIALACDSGWGLAAGTARAWFARSPRRLAAVGGTGGLMMIGLGVSVATAGRTD
ncbi:UNVERIFIED_ORG: threonine/homoserine/homoserine lactone efflux protein [Actinomadura viridilutea]